MLAPRCATSMAGVRNRTVSAEPASCTCNGAGRDFRDTGLAQRVANFGASLNSSLLLAEIGLPSAVGLLAAAAAI